MERNPQKDRGASAIGLGHAPDAGAKTTNAEKAMRFMLQVRANRDSEAGIMPAQELFAAMGKFNNEMVEAGIMLAADGLHPSSKGARVLFAGAKRTVIEGPFPDPNELIAGFWMIQVKSKEEAIDWARRAPFLGGVVEIRQVFEAEDFGPALTPELREAEESMRARLASRLASHNQH